MFPRSQLTAVAVVLITAWAAVACQREPALEEIPTGADITIETQDGQRVSGTLVAVSEQAVSVAKGASSARVERSTIAAVRSGEAARAEHREVTVPAGAAFDARLETTIASDSSRVEDPVRASLLSPLVVDGVTIAPSGSTLLGIVSAVRESGRVKGRAELGLRFHQLRAQSVTYEIRTTPLHWVAEATTRDDATKIGIGAVAGAIVGGITGGGKGAALGSAVGGGGGSAVVLATRGDEISVESGSTLRVQLTAPLSVTAHVDTGE
jgi:hypothetical protein